ncbi:MAG: hypothetical protein AAGI07_12715 [Bacteroidota bacterium]
MRKTPNYIDEHVLSPIICLFTLTSLIGLIYFLNEWSIITSESEKLRFYNFTSDSEKQAYTLNVRNSSMILLLLILFQAFSMVIKKRWLLTAQILLAICSSWYIFF